MRKYRHTPRIKVRKGPYTSNVHETQRLFGISDRLLEKRKTCLLAFNTAPTVKPAAAIFHLNPCGHILGYKLVIRHSCDAMSQSTIHLLCVDKILHASTPMIPGLPSGSGAY